MFPVSFGNPYSASTNNAAARMQMLDGSTKDGPSLMAAKQARKKNDHHRHCSVLAIAPAGVAHPVPVTSPLFRTVVTLVSYTRH